MGYMKDYRGSRVDDFDPLRDIGPVLAWYDFASALDGLANGASIERVADLSGYGHDLIQATSARQPSKQVASDGAPVARFADDYLQCANFGAAWPFGATYAPPVTIIASVKLGTQTVTYPMVTGGGTTGGDSRIVVQSTTGCAFTSTAGGTVGSTQSMNVMDGEWHTIIAVVLPTGVATYVDGFLTGASSTTTASAGLKNLLVGAEGSSRLNQFVGDIREIIVLGRALRFEEVEQVSRQFAERSPAAADGVCQAGVGLVATTSSNGQAITYYEPDQDSDVLLLWSHPHSHNQFIQPGYWAFPLQHIASSKGWHFAASNMHGDSWGNATALADLLDLYNYVNARHPISKVILVGASMGGLATANAISKNTVPNVVGGYFIDAVLNLADQYANATYTASIKTAYGIASDGSDYAAKTAGYDPYLAAAGTFAKRLRFVASTTDTSVNKANNTDLFVSKVASSSIEEGVVTHLGGHLTGYAAAPDDLAAFVERCIA